MEKEKVEKENTFSPCPLCGGDKVNAELLSGEVKISCKCCGVTFCLVDESCEGLEDFANLWNHVFENEEKGKCRA